MKDYSNVEKYEYILFKEPIRLKRVEYLYGLVKDGLINIEEFGLLLDRCSVECTEDDNMYNKRKLNEGI